MVYPFDLPASLEPRLARMKAWLRARKIPLSDERTQANAFFVAAEFSLVAAKPHRLEQSAAAGV